MKSNNALVIIFLFTICLSNLFGQKTGNNYKFSKFTLSSGIVIKAKNLTFSEDNISFLKYNSTTGQKEIKSYDLSVIQDIQVATKSYALPGLLIGASLGFLTMVIVESQIQKSGDYHTYMTNYGYSTTTYTYYEEAKIMALGAKLGIVAGGSLIGTIVGASIKNGWKTIFPKSSSIFNNLDYYMGYQHGLKFTYKF